MDGEPVDQVKPFGWATGFEVSQGGEATLRFRTPLVRYGVLAIQAIVWLWVLRVLVRRRFELPDVDDEPARPPAHAASARAVGPVADDAGPDDAREDTPAEAGA